MEFLYKTSNSIFDFNYISVTIEISPDQFILLNDSDELFTQPMAAYTEECLLCQLTVNKTLNGFIVLSLLENTTQTCYHEGISLVIEEYIHYLDPYVASHSIQMEQLLLPPGIIE